MPRLDENRLFPIEASTRGLARGLYDTVAHLPIVSPHGHTEPRWFAEDVNFTDPASMLVTPDHYIYRMLFSHGYSLESLGVTRVDGMPVENDNREIWRIFAQNYHLFNGTPSRLWLDHAFQDVFGIDVQLSADTADYYFDHISESLAKPAFSARRLYERFNIEVIATTEGALDNLRWHQKLSEDDWQGNVISAYRPDTVVDPEWEGFKENLDQLGEMTGFDTNSWSGYLDAHRERRAFFKSLGTTSTDHGHKSARTENLPQAEAATLFHRIRGGSASREDADSFRGQMLTEMARMSLEDGLTMQIHAGPYRNHSDAMLAKFGRDRGFDTPAYTDYVRALKPMLDVVGTNPELTIVVFTLDETAYARDLAPLAGVYPALKIGAPWWFFDSPEGMRRFREQTTETAGFYNCAGFVDDARTLCSLPARHDVARRVDCSYLASLVMSGRLAEEYAADIANDLAYGLVKKTYKL